MDNQELKKLLEKLHREFDQTPTVDSKGRELLRRLDADITELIERSENGMETPFTYDIRPLEDSIRHFEVTHPNVIDILSRLMTILSNSGI